MKKDNPFPDMLWTTLGATPKYGKEAWRRTTWADASLDHAFSSQCPHF
jgi:hypothetical protein